MTKDILLSPSASQSPRVAGSAVIARTKDQLHACAAEAEAAKAKQRQRSSRVNRPPGKRNIPAQAKDAEKSLRPSNGADNTVPVHPSPIVKPVVLPETILQDFVSCLNKVNFDVVRQLNTSPASLPSLIETPPPGTTCFNKCIKSTIDASLVLMRKLKNDTCQDDVSALTEKYINDWSALCSDATQRTKLAHDTVTTPTVQHAAAQQQDEVGLPKQAGQQTRHGELGKNINTSTAVGGVDQGFAVLQQMEGGGDSNPVHGTDLERPTTSAVSMLLICWSRTYLASMLTHTDFIPDGLKQHRAVDWLVWRLLQVLLLLTALHAQLVTEQLHDGNSVAQFCRHQLVQLIPLLLFQISSFVHASGEHETGLPASVHSGGAGKECMQCIVGLLSAVLKNSSLLHIKLLLSWSKAILASMDCEHGQQGAGDRTAPQRYLKLSRFIYQQVQVWQRAEQARGAVIVQDPLQLAGLLLDCMPCEQPSNGDGGQPVPVAGSRQEEEEVQCRAFPDERKKIELQQRRIAEQRARELERARYAPPRCQPPGKVLVAGKLRGEDMCRAAQEIAEREKAKAGRPQEQQHANVTDVQQLSCRKRTAQDHMPDTAGTSLKKRAMAGHAQGQSAGNAPDDAGVSHGPSNHVQIQSLPCSPTPNTQRPAAGPSHAHVHAHVPGHALPVTSLKAVCHKEDGAEGAEQAAATASPEQGGDALADVSSTPAAQQQKAPRSTELNLPAEAGCHPSNNTRTVQPSPPPPAHVMRPPPSTPPRSPHVEPSPPAAVVKRAPILLCGQSGKLAGHHTAAGLQDDDPGGAAAVQQARRGSHDLHHLDAIGRHAMTIHPCHRLQSPQHHDDTAPANPIRHSRCFQTAKGGGPPVENADGTCAAPAAAPAAAGVTRDDLGEAPAIVRASDADISLDEHERPPCAQQMHASRSSAAVRTHPSKQPPTNQAAHATSHDVAVPQQASLGERCPGQRLRNTTAGHCNTDQPDACKVLIKPRPPVLVHQLAAAGKVMPTNVLSYTKASHDVPEESSNILKHAGTAPCQSHNLTTVDVIDTGRRVDKQAQHDLSNARSGGNTSLPSTAIPTDEHQASPYVPEEAFQNFIPPNSTWQPVEPQHAHDAHHIDISSEKKRKAQTSSLVKDGSDQLQEPEQLQSIETYHEPQRQGCGHACPAPVATAAPHSEDHMTSNHTNMHSSGNIDNGDCDSVRTDREQQHQRKVGTDYEENGLWPYGAEVGMSLPVMDLSTLDLDRFKKISQADQSAVQHIEDEPESEGVVAAPCILPLLRQYQQFVDVHDSNMAAAEHTHQTIQYDIGGVDGAAAKWVTKFGMCMRTVARVGRRFMRHARPLATLIQACEAYQQHQQRQQAVTTTFDDPLARSFQRFFGTLCGYHRHDATSDEDDEEQHQPATSGMFENGCTTAVFTFPTRLVHKVCSEEFCDLLQRRATRVRQETIRLIRHAGKALDQHYDMKLGMEVCIQYAQDISEWYSRVVSNIVSPIMQLLDDLQNGGQMQMHQGSFTACAPTDVTTQQLAADIRSACEDYTMSVKPAVEAYNALTHACWEASAVREGTTIRDTANVAAQLTSIILRTPQLQVRFRGVMSQYFRSDCTAKMLAAYQRLERCRQGLHDAGATPGSEVPHEDCDLTPALQLSGLTQQVPHSHKAQGNGGQQRQGADVEIDDDDIMMTDAMMGGGTIDRVCHQVGGACKPRAAKQQQVSLPLLKATSQQQQQPVNMLPVITSNAHGNAVKARASVLEKASALTGNKQASHLQGTNNGVTEPGCVQERSVKRARCCSTAAAQAGTVAGEYDSDHSENQPKPITWALKKPTKKKMGKAEVLSHMQDLSNEPLDMTIQRAHTPKRQARLR